MILGALRAELGTKMPPNNARLALNWHSSTALCRANSAQVTHSLALSRILMWPQADRPAKGKTKCCFTLSCLWILSAFEEQFDQSIWQSALTFPGHYVLQNSPQRTPMVLLLLRRARHLKSRLHRAGSLACIDLCLCGVVLYQFSQRCSSRLQCKLGCVLERRSSGAKTRIAKGENGKPTSLRIPCSKSPPARNVKKIPLIKVVNIFTAG